MRNYDYQKETGELKDIVEDESLEKEGTKVTFGVKDDPDTE